MVAAKKAEQPGLHGSSKGANREDGWSIAMECENVQDFFTLCSFTLFELRSKYQFVLKLPVNYITQLFQKPLNSKVFVYLAHTC